MERIADLFVVKSLGLDSVTQADSLSHSPVSHSSVSHSSVPSSSLESSLSSESFAQESYPQNNSLRYEGDLSDAQCSIAVQEIDNQGMLSSRSCHTTDSASTTSAETSESLPINFIPNEDLVELWSVSKENLRSELDEQLFAAWIDPLRLTSLQLPTRFDGEAVATFSTANKFCCDHVQRTYSQMLSATLGKLICAPVKLVFQIHQIAPTSTAPLRAAFGFEHSSPTAQNNTHPSIPTIEARSVQDLIEKTVKNLGNVQSNGASAFRDSSDLGKRARAVSPRAVSPSARTVSRRPVSGKSTGLRNSLEKGTSESASSLAETNLNPKYNFSNFVVGSCNQFAHAVGLRVSENLGSSYNPLFVYGGVGLGKTHLANAIGNATRRRNKKVLLVSSETFVSELIASLRGNRMEQFKSKFRSLDLLIVDDIQFIIGKERTQEEFFHTFNDLYNRHKQIIITSDKTPQELIGLEERLRTRFASGLSVDLQTPDFETRVAILSKKAETEGIMLPDDVARVVAKNIDTNIRELEGALNRIQAMSSLQRTSINVALAEEVLRSLSRAVKPAEITYDSIQRVVAERYNVSLNDLLGKRRTQNIALARQVAMYLCRRLTAYSYPEIGAFFGGRDHSTVIHANRSITERIEGDNEFGVEITSLEKKIRA